ncbi:MAG: hypothetical protein CL916_02165 [Deltaproteobacteria bacterium]|nr:hypothetical protein [Deltaproteobacteria bacterium]
MVALAFIFACSGDKHQQELDEQYQQGYESGQNEGYDSGLQDGLSQGYDSGVQDGLSEGYDSGVIDGYDSGLSEGYDSGLGDGYDEGYSEGYDDGYEEAMTVEDGWTLYQQGSFEEACTSFMYDGYENGITTDNANGLGWCSLRQFQAEIAIQWFEIALTMDDTNEDAYAGLSSATMITHDFDYTISSIDDLLDLNPQYSSSIETIDSTSLSTAKVLAYVFSGDEVGASIALLDMDDTHDLVPSDSSSWEVDATAYPSFQRAVIAKLVSMGVL